MIKGFIRSMDLYVSDLEFQEEMIYSDNYETEKEIHDKHDLLQVELAELVKKLVEENLNRLLRFIRDMNTTSKHCRLAQRILFALLKTFSHNYMIEHSNKIQIEEEDQGGKFRKNKEKPVEVMPEKEEGNQFEQLIETLQAYSERHQTRLQKYVKKSFYLDFLLSKLNSLVFVE
jgi:U3 small nucleolar RNA-associated protein 13